MRGDIAESDQRWRLAIVDDDVGVLRAMQRVLKLHEYEVTSYSSSVEFLDHVHELTPDLLLVDLRMPDVDGLALQAALAERGFRIPTVFLSGQGDIATSVKALRGGAVDFLEKPCDEATLLEALHRATRIASAQREDQQLLRPLLERVARLTPREYEVLASVAAGRLNKQIAAMLGTKEKTIKVHRSRVMAKMEAESIPHLVRMFDLIRTRIGPPDRRRHARAWTPPTDRYPTDAPGGDGHPPAW